MIVRRYGRRTFWSICFIPLVFIFVFLLFAEAAFWAFVAFVALCLSICVLAVLVAVSGR
jgi:Na+/melibiose symporter-like transporter